MCSMTVGWHRTVPRRVCVLCINSLSGEKWTREYVAAARTKVLYNGGNISIPDVSNLCVIWGSRIYRARLNTGQDKRLSSSLISCSGQNSSESSHFTGLTTHDSRMTSGVHNFIAMTQKNPRLQGAPFQPNNLSGVR